jgi:DNA (cytosine-5)-methyltransferase 1
MHRQSDRKNLIGLDFFCGAGGVTNGFRKAGIDVIAGFDINPIMKYAYEENNKPAKFVLSDIADIEKNENVVNSLLNRHSEKLKVFSACAPCQPFSSQNKKTSKDERSGLLLYFAKLVENLPLVNKPDFIFAENVGFMQKRGELVLNEIILIFAKLGYKILEPKIHNAVKFGVPQSRRRLIFLAVKELIVRNNENIFSWEYFENKYASIEKIVTVNQAFRNYEKRYKTRLSKLFPGETDEKDSIHQARNLSELNIKRLQNGISRVEWPKELWLECHSKEYLGHKDVYGRMDFNKPAPTLTTKCNCISNGRYGHPLEDRGISLREAAILQTMDNYKFEEPVSLSKVALQIGNAVPPLLAQQFGKYFIELSRK